MKVSKSLEMGAFRLDPRVEGCFRAGVQRVAEIRVLVVGYRLLRLPCRPVQLRALTRLQRRVTAGDRESVALQPQPYRAICA
jgi:hypothetical protein